MARPGNEQAKTHVRRALLVVVCALVSMPLGRAQARPAAAGDHRVVLHDVAVRPGTTVDINLEVFVNERHPCQGRDVLAVHGFAHTAATWQPLAEAVFEETPGHGACRIVAIDLPGHGGSGLPAGGPTFGELTLDDYVGVLQGSLERLPAAGIRPDVLVGHSQGALVVQMLQQTLADGNTSLRRFGIRHVVLLAPVAPQAIPWAFVDNGTAGTFLQQFVAFNAALGTHIAIPDAIWPFVFFSDLSGAVVAGAPSGAQVAARGLNAPEPLFGALQLVGAPPFVRPVVDAGIFGPGSKTTLEVASFAQDTIVTASEAAMLYEYLTGDGTGAGVVEVTGASAVHDMYVSDPRTLLAALRER